MFFVLILIRWRSCDNLQVFLLQKAAVYKCNMAGKPAVVTRVVYSMTDNLRPTRAEATDVANAVLDGKLMFLHNSWIAGLGLHITFLNYSYYNCVVLLDLIIIMLCPFIECQLQYLELYKYLRFFQVSFFMILQAVMQFFLVLKLCEGCTQLRLSPLLVKFVLR